MKHTQGKANVADYGNCIAVEITLENGQEHTLFTDQFCYAKRFNGDGLANAELIAEAFNVTNESGLTPRQLLEQRDELLACLNSMINEFEYDNATEYQCNLFYNSKKAINSAQNK